MVQVFVRCWARPRRFLHCSDSVSFLRDFDRAGEATGMPLRDPEPTSDGLTLRQPSLA